MKKTIIITISMLAVCAFALVVFAGQLEDAWKQPQENESNFTTSSPVEQVESEFKEIGAYPFVVFNDYIETLEDKRGMEALMAMQIEKDENMISEAEAAYIGGNALEKMFPNETFTDKEFIIVPLKWKSPHMAERTVFEGLWQIENPYDHETDPGRRLLSYAYWVDAYTGEVIYVSQGAAETDVNRHMTEQQALEYATGIAKAMGYSSYSKYIISNSQYAPGVDANFWAVELFVSDDTSLSIGFNDLENSFMYAVNDTTSEYFKEVTQKGITVQ